MYAVSIRAVSATPGDASAWVATASIKPLNPQLSNLTYTRGNGQIALSWTPNPWTTGYEIDCAVLGSAYTRCATLTNQDHSATEHSVTISTWTAGGTNYAIDNSSTYDIRVCSTNATGYGCYLAPLVHPITLTASNVAATTATLTIARYTGNWYYNATSGPHTTCQGPVSGASQNLTGLTANTAYTYSAYSDSGCSTLLATAAAFTTSHPSISNLAGDTDDGVYCRVHPGSLCFLDFTTGASGGGYTLTSVTVEFAAPTGAPGNAVITLRAVDANNTARPAATALATLSGTSPTTAGQYVFTCSGAGCDLTASTKYFLGFSAASGNSNNLQRVVLTTSDAPTLDPANSGWSLGTDVLSRTASGGGGGYTWFSYGSVPKLKLIAKPNPILTASNVAGTTATLSIANHHAAWYYKHTNTGATCDGPVSGTTKNLTGLTAGTTYTYSAYSDSGCTNANLLATAAQFTTPSLTASNVAATTATLTIASHSAAWWYDANTGPDTACQSVSAGTASDNLTGLTAGTVYAYTAYGKSGCNAADLLATTTFGTPSTFSVSNLGKADGPAAFNLSSDYAQEFTTGSAAGGYTLSSVTLDFTIITNASQIEASIRAVQSNDTPATTARATLTGTPAVGEVTFTCDATNTNNDCSLAANTSYFVYVDALSFTPNQQTTTASDDEDLQPSGNGWSIANAARYQADSWNEHPQSLAMKMSVSATGGAASASLTATSTSLTIADYTGSWYYQANAAPHATCQGPVSGTSQALSGLTGGTSYTYKAYADSACSVLLATAAAFTAPVTVSTLDGSSYSVFEVGNNFGTHQQGAQAFTTGSNTGGYTLSSIDIRFGSKIGNPTNLVVTLHAASGSNPNTTTTLATLDGNSSPSSANVYPYTCSGSGCNLSASTTYFVLLKALNSSGISYYQVEMTQAAETTQPSNNGWSIADKGRDGEPGSWFDMLAAVKMKVAAVPK